MQPPDPAHPTFAAEVAAAYGSLPGVIAVALAGSAASGLSDTSSDLDFYVYALHTIPLPLRRHIADQFAARSEIGNDAWEPGDEWIAEHSGQKVDVIYRTPTWIEEQLDRVLVRHQASVGYSTAFWHNVLHARALVDPSGWYRALQQQARQPYPAALKRAIVAKNHPLLRDAQSSYLNQIRAAVDRNDHLSVQHRVTALLSSYFDILFAINELPHPGEKRLLHFATAEGVRHPFGMIDQLDALLRVISDGRVVAHANTLTDALDTLLAEESLLPPVIRVT